MGERTTPQTIVDVGVATGTPWLYAAFPAAKLVLIDPNPACAADLVRLKAQYGADVYLHGLGAAPGELTLHVDVRVPSSSGFLRVTDAFRAVRGAEREYSDVRVPITTLDVTLAGADYAEPLLLKIDTEGFELEVLKGAEETLTRTVAVIAEVSVVQRFAGSYQFADLIGWMQAHGFRVFDILDVRTLGRNGPVNYVDLMFVRHEADAGPV